MADLTQAEADYLLAMEKHQNDDKEWHYPTPGNKIIIPLSSLDNKEPFLLDIGLSGKITLKGRYQNRARGIVILARVDFCGSPHRNPDDTVVDCPHLHIYKEDYGDKWAYPLPEDRFKNPSDLRQLLMDFMRYCNIVDPPVINPRLAI